MLIQPTALAQADLHAAIIRDPLIVSPNTTVMAAIAEMSGIRTSCLADNITRHSPSNIYLEARSSCVLVVEVGQLVGIMTERDVVRLSTQPIALDTLLIGEAMTPEPITLRESDFTDLFSALNLLQQHHIRHIPLLDQYDRVVGLLTHESLRQIFRPIDLLRLRTVAEVMTADALCVHPSTPMFTVAQNMAEHRVGCIVLAEPFNLHSTLALNSPIGIITERDIVQFQALNLNLATCEAQAVMSSPVFSVSLSDNLWQVHNLMEQHLIRRAVVVGDHSELLGIVTQSDLLQILNPLELYKLTEVLEHKVGLLEAEKIKLLASRTADLEHQVRVRTAALNAQAKRQQVILTLASQIRSSLNLQATLDIAVEQVRLLLGCDRVTIWQFNADGQVTVAAESMPDTGRSLIGAQVIDNCFSPQSDCIEAYRQGKVRVISDIYTADMSDCHRNMLSQLDIRAKILVPLISGEGLWGLLNATESQSAREWTHEEVDLLQELSVHLAIAIQQATAYQQTQAELIERQQAEARLRESEQRYATLVALAPVGIFRTDVNGNSTYVNQWCCEMIGLDPTNISSEGWMQMVHPEDRRRVRLELLQARRENRLFQLEYRFQRPDGTVVWVLGQAVAERDETGQISGYVGTITDISDRKQAEEAQLRSQQMRLELELLENILETILAGYWDADMVNKQQYISPRFKQMFGYEDSELANSPETWKQIIFSEDLPRAEASFKRHVQSQGAIPYYNELRYHHKDGSTVWVICSGRVIEWDAEGNPLRMIGCHFDVTDRKKTELQLQQQAEYEQLLGLIAQRIRSSLNLGDILATSVAEVHQVLHSDRVLIYRIFPDGSAAAIAESVSPLWPQIQGRTFPPEAIPQATYDQYIEGSTYVLQDRETEPVLPCLEDFLPDIQIRAKLVVPIVQNQTLWGLMITHQCDRPRDWQAWELNLLQRVANQLAIAIQQADLVTQLQQELHERQQTEARLIESNRQLAISNDELARVTRLKDEFLANMSHELRTPLNAILGMTEGLQDRVFGEINNTQQQALQTIDRSGNHLLALINDILDLAKIESGQVDLDCTPTNLQQLCQSSMVFVKQQAFKKNIQIQTHIDAGLPTLSLDERRIRQVLINLLNNAVKFTAEGGRVTLAATLEPPHPSNQDATPPFVRITVTDTGIGIAPTDLQKLFQPFVQIDSALNRQYEGTGLGLSLVKRIVELHDGSVRVTSQVGVGSQFTIDLPCPKDHQLRSPAQLSVALAESITTLPTVTGSPLILLAEDNDANIATLSSYLKAKGYRLLIAKTGQEAIDMTHTHQPDLILMDIQMPIMDGLEAIQHIRHTLKLVKIPIIALTALAMANDQERCLAAGANDYLAKPVKLKDLVVKIQNLLTHE